MCNLYIFTPAENTTAELREQDEKRKGEHAAVVEDLEEIKEKTMDTWALIGMFKGIMYIEP